MKGQVVRIPHDPVLAQQLKNHLNVIKSREKKLFESLQLDFISSIISVEKLYIHEWYNPVNLVWLESRPGQVIPLPASCRTKECFEIKLVAPKKRRKYSVFSIQESAASEPSPS